MEESELNEIKTQNLEALSKLKTIVRTDSDRVSEYLHHLRLFDVTTKYGIFFKQKTCNIWDYYNKNISIEPFLEELKPILNFYKERLPISSIEFYEVIYQIFRNTF